MGIGGAERLVVALAAGLAARGHEVLVAGPPGPLDAELYARRLPLPERGRSPAGAAESVLRLAGAIRRTRPDVVHGHNVKASAVAAGAARLARGPRRPPVIATFHGVLPAEYPSAARLLRSADVVVCVSEDLAGALSAHGVAARVIHNGVALPHGEPRGGEIAGATRPLVVAVGRLVEQKNHERLLLAARHVRDAGVPAYFAIVGDGPLRERLTARAAALGLADCVRFTGARDDAPAVMARADLVAFSSDWEGLSVAALEALAAGTPLVSTPVEGMRELLGTGAGSIAASMEPEVLGALIVELLRDEPRRAAMGAEGRRLVAERFSAAAMVAGYESLYREALLSRRG
jgi:glycosyltransferase involved in cell wall biosynthesis